jgi:ketosteroid isomerase-like protein
VSDVLSPAEVLEQMTDAYNRGDYDAGLELIDPQAIDHSAPGGPSSDLVAWRGRWEQARADVPDLQVEVEQVLVDGDMVARRLRTRGLRDGQPVEMRGMDMVRVRDGRLVEHWAVAIPGSTAWG